MTETQFDNGYWYAVELKEFAKQLGIPSVSKLRKDELELSIKHFLRSGKIIIPTKRNLKKKASRTLKSDSVSSFRSFITRVTGYPQNVRSMEKTRH